MDLFEEQVNKMQNEISNIKYNLKNIKKHNKQAMHSIINSLNSFNDKKSEKKNHKNKSTFIFPFNQHNTKGRNNYNYCKEYNSEMHHREESMDAYKNKSNLIECNNKLTLKHYSNMLNKVNSTHVSRNNSRMTKHIDISIDPNYTGKYLNDSICKINTKNITFFTLKNNNNNNNKTNNNNTNNNNTNNNNTNNNNTNNNNTNNNTNNTNNNRNNKENELSYYKGIINSIIGLMNEHVDSEVTVDNMIDKLKDYFYIQKENNNLMTNIADLYYMNNNDNNIKRNTVTIDELYQWLNKSKECQYYKDYCDDIMMKYQIGNFEKLKKQIKEAFEYRNKNEKFVVNMKKLLCENYSRKNFCPASTNENTIQTDNNQNSSQIPKKKLVE